MVEINDLSEYLTPELCEDAGIIVIDINDNDIHLGAMNLDYMKVKQVIKKLKKNLS